MDSIEDFIDGIGENDIEPESYFDDFGDRETSRPETFDGVGYTADFEISYDLATREGREKLAKDLHQDVRENAMLSAKVNLSTPGRDPRSSKEIEDDVEQKAYEMAMEQGATQRTLSGTEVRDLLRDAVHESQPEEDSILEPYEIDLDSPYEKPEFEF